MGACESEEPTCVKSPWNIGHESTLRLSAETTIAEMPEARNSTIRAREIAVADFIFYSYYLRS